MAEVLTLPVKLLVNGVSLKSVGKEDLDNPRAKLAAGGCNAMTCAAIARGEDFSGYLCVCDDQRAAPNK